MSLDRLAEAIRLCAACSLGARGKGVPGRFVGEEDPDGALSASACQCGHKRGQHCGRAKMSAPPIVTHPCDVGVQCDCKDFTRGGEVMVLGEAPGAVEQERGKPFVGQSGELLHAMFEECGLTSYYVSNIAKHQPYKDRNGKQQAPSKTEIQACAPFLRAEFNLIRPSRLILLGKTASKLVVEGNFSMGKVVNQTYTYWKLVGAKDVNWPSVEEGIPTLVLYHPAYFLRQRTAPWIQKQIRDWKSAVRLFLGAKAPTYQIEEVKCEVHN